MPGEIIQEIIFTLKKLEQDFDIEFNAHNIIPPFIKKDFLDHFTEKLEKVIELEKLLDKTKHMRKVVSDVDSELSDVDKKIANLSELIAEKKTYYTKLIDEQKNSNRYAEKIRDQRNKTTSIEKTISPTDTPPIRSSPYGFFMKIAVPIGLAAVATTGVVLALSSK